MGFVKDVGDFLEANGIAGGSTDWHLAERSHDDAPGMSGRAIIISEDGGEAEVPAQEGVGSGAIAKPGALIRIRGRPTPQAGSGEAFNKAQEVLDALHGRLRTEMGDTFYHRVWALTPEPVFIGVDESQRPQFTVAVRGFRSLAATSI